MRPNVERDPQARPLFHSVRCPLTSHTLIMPGERLELWCGNLKRTVVRIPAKADSRSGDGGQPRSEAT
jgi:hypothetical protein